MLNPVQRLEAILDGAEVGIWQLYVPTGAITESNTYSRLFGGAEDAAGSTLESPRWAENIHPADLLKARARLDQLLAGEVDDYVAEYRVRRTGGSWNTLRSRGCVVERDADGKPLWVAGAVIDVSGEKELDRRLHAIFDRPFQFIGLLSIEGILIETNRTSLQQSGHKAEDVLGKPFWQGPFFQHSPELQLKVREGIKRAACGEAVRFEISHPDPNGVIVIVDFTLTPLRVVVPRHT